jgi:hypothetical protein
MNFSQHKVLLASVPVITYVIYLIYLFIRDVPTGIINSLFATFALPATIVGQVIVYYVLSLFEPSAIPTYILLLGAIASIAFTVYKMVTFKKIKTNTLPKRK